MGERDELERRDGVRAERFSSAQLRMMGLVGAVTLGSVLYRVLVAKHLEQTALLFIGVPGLMAVALAMAPPAKTLAGGVAKGITFMLLLSGPLLGEGFICVLMASPIFFAVAAIVVSIVEYLRKRRRGVRLGCCLLVLLPMSLEGTAGWLSFDRNERVVATAVVDGTVEDVRARMGMSPRVDLTLPAYLRMGFPRPVSAVGSGLVVGDLRTVHFAGGEGMPCDLVMRVAAVGDGHARFEVARDGCEGMHWVGHWVGLRESDVTWERVDGGHTRVRWAIAYERRLDPAWYFGPWERYGVGLAAGYLIRANAGGR
jgi:hypothetical protein